MLKNERGHYLTSAEYMQRFGYPAGGHWPPEGFGAYLDGVQFLCKPRQPPGSFKSSKHRLFYKCELCDPAEWVPTGRACQHKHNWERKHASKR